MIGLQELYTRQKDALALNQSFWYAVYLALEPLTREAGYFLPFFSILASTAVERSTSHRSANLMRYSRTSDISSPT